MTYTITYFFRHSDAIYFSLEKLFTEISRQVRSVYGDRFKVIESRMPFPSKIQRLAANIFFTKRQQSDINHITGDVHYILLGCSKKKVNVLTIHDCIMLHRHPPGTLRHRIMKWLWYDLPVRKADAVTVISENTKREVLHFTNCDPRKISVIPDFFNPVFRPQPYSFNKLMPRILFIGSTPNKNLNKLIPAIAGLTVKLDIVGHISKEQEDLLQEHGIDYERSSGLSEEALLNKYAACDLLAFPSTYEGFGLPIIEAQAIGRPVLTSNLAPMNEVAGNAACLIDPDDVSSIREGLLSILQDGSYRDRLIAEGFINVSRFRLEKITDQYVRLYEELLQRKHK